MQKRLIAFNFKGIALDAINGQVNSLFAYKIMNMRISASKNSNVLLLTTEKGTNELRVSLDSDSFPEDSVYLGHCIVNQYVVIFLTSQSGDYIYRLDFKPEDEHDDCECEQIFYGNLNFDQDHRIESIGIYENENIQKVYWIDGINQPRVINVVDKDLPINVSELETYTLFDFLLPTIDHDINNTINVTKSNGGQFSVGVIQYCYSLYNLNNLETSILDVSPINYITIDDHGAEQNKLINCSFIINIHCDNTEFDYLRLYSILRNSLNGSPLVRVVLDIKLTNSDITVIDDGLIGYDIDPSIIKYILLPLYPQTITHKDNTLFLGNYSTNEILEKTKLYTHQDTLEPESILRNTGIYAYNQDDEGFYIYHPQLNNNSQQIKSFKYLEWYKLGVQFQDKYGNWSEPYFIKDVLQQFSPSITNSGEYQLPCFGIDINEIYYLLSNEERERYIKIRPVVSFPDISERSILCQGILNPTVFNMTDRMLKTCYALSSWFFRPFIPDRFQHDSNTTYGSQYYGAVINYNHYDALNSSMDIGGEILGMYFDEDIDYTSAGGEYLYAQRPYISIEDQDYNPQKYKNFYYVDQSVATLNSPDIEFDPSLKTMDLNGYNIRVVGIIPFNNTAGKYNIISSNPQFFNDKYSYRRFSWSTFSSTEMYIRSDKLPQGFYDKPLVINYNPSSRGNGILCAQNCWFDDISDLSKYQNQNWIYDWNQRDRNISYYVYPWLRQYLNNYNHGNAQFRTNITDDDYGYFEDTESAKITSKILSNLHFSLNTKFFDYNSEQDISVEKMLYNNNQLQKLHDSKLYNSSCNQYYQYNSDYVGRSFDINLGGMVLATIAGEYVLGYPITVEDCEFMPSDNTDNIDFSGRIANSLPREFYDQDVHGTLDSEYFISPNNRSADPILISYKSSPHIVIELAEEYGKKNVLPALEQLIDGVLLNNQYVHSFDSLWFLPWHDSGYDDRTNGYIQKILTDTGVTNYKAYLLMAEIYRDNTSGSYFNIWDDYERQLSNESNLYSRIWIPAGKVKDFHEDVDSTHTYLYWIEGDTYYQRYDCVKTKPFNENEYQSLVEIGSFMVETHINLDGRYDTNRGMIDNTIVSDDNFNLLNSVYNQYNNFYNYNILDEEKFNINHFDTSVIWSGNKIYGETIDKWTKISPVNKLDLDGNKGPINALRKFRNNIYAFLTNSVSRIRFNDRTALSTVEGLPIQLASTDKVDGYEFINEVIGCLNKFSNIETENGIYFIDNNTPGIYKLGYNEYGNINIDNISKQKLMQRWFENNNDRNALTFYDRNINEVVFNINNNSLVFSMESGYFSLFVNYEIIKDIISIKNYSIAPFEIHGSIQLHTLRSGIYSNFFGEYKDYSVEFIATPEVGQDTNGIIRDCIYDNVWYRSDVFNKGNDQFDNNNINTNYLSEETFDEISVIDTYQNNGSVLDFDLTPNLKITTLRKKFMMWYAKIPRHKYRMQNKNYDRMRDKFLKISFIKHQNADHKMVLGDIAVDCFY